jgi:hypothetical protein
LDELDEVFGDKSGRSTMEAEMLQQAYVDVGLLEAAGLEKHKGPASTNDSVSDHPHKEKA